jgi:outer membrane protein TolC
MTTTMSKKITATPFLTLCKASTFLLLCIINMHAYAQIVRHPKAALEDTSKVTDIRERLVQLAMQSPYYEIADRQMSIADHQLRKAKNSVLSKFSLNANANEYTTKIKSTPQNTNLFFPLFNFAVSIPFDVFSSRKHEVGAARENLGIAEAYRNQRFREIKADILGKYEDYLMFKQQVQFASQIAQDAEAIFLQAEKDFSEGIIKQEDYNKAYKDRTEQKTHLAEVVRNLNVSKIEIEKIIGIPIENVVAKK